MTCALPALLGTLLITAAACSSPDSPSDTGNSGNSGGGTTGQTLTLTIDGTAFKPTTVTTFIIPPAGPLPEQLMITAAELASGTNPQQSLTIVVPSAVGAYQTRSTTNSAVRVQRGTQLDAYWEAAGPLGTGTIEVTSRTSTTAVGRVTATMAPAGQFAGSASKTCEGTFSVRF